MKLGPITSWWIKLQDRTHYYGVSTASCSYLLSNPVAEYLPTMTTSLLFLRAVSLTDLYLKNMHRPEGQKTVNQVDAWLAVLVRESPALTEEFVCRHAKAIHQHISTQEAYMASHLEM